MIGFIFAIIAGSFMAIQGVFNTRLAQSSSLWVSNSWVHLTGLIVCIALWLFTGKQSLKPLLLASNRWYLLGGVLGAIIVFSVIKSMAALGPSVAVMTFLSAQLITAYVIELFGLFGTETVSFDFKKAIGMALVIGGIIVSKI